MKNIDALNIGDILSVLSLVEKKNFNQAALNRKVSQPALSMQIKKVEELLKIKIFERTKKATNPTSEGRKISELFKVIIEQIESSLSEIEQESKSILMKEFKLGIIPTLAPYYIPKLISKIRKDFPQLKLSIKEDLSSNLISHLSSGELDAIIMAETNTPQSILSFSLFKEPFYTAKSKDKPKHSTLLLLEEGHCLRNQVMQICRKKGADIQATSLESLRQMVALGLGYTLMPALAAEASNNISELIDYKLDSECREICFYCRSSYPNSGDIKALISFFRNSTKQFKTLTLTN